MEAISRVVSLALNLTTHSDSYEVAVSLVGNDEIARLNSAYRGVEGVTDVLSSPCASRVSWRCTTLRRAT